MKKLLLLTFLAAQSLKLSAYIHPDAGSIALQAEFLYLLPSIDDTYYVAEGNNDNPVLVTGSTKRNNDFNFTPGFRIEGAYGFCDNGQLIARYSRLRATTTDTVTGPTLSPVVGKATLVFFPGSASSHLDLLYQNVDVLYGMGIWNSCKFNIDVQAGLEYAYVRVNENYTFLLTGASVTESYHEKTWGIGPQIGVAMEYDLFDFACYCPGRLSIVSRASSSLLVSETTANQHSAFPSSGNFFNVEDSSTWRIVPAFHARLGFNYAACFSCVNASFELGYEFNTYLRAVARDIDNNNAGSRSNAFSNHYDFSANGLYAAIGLAF